MSTTTKAAPKAVTTRLTVGEIAVGDVFSEMSHYTFLAKVGENYQFKHHGSGQTVLLGKPYVEGLLCTANQYHKDIEVGKEDKLWTEKRLQEATASGTFKGMKILPNVGDVMTPGIRTIWENIHSAQVFKVCFQKQDSALSAKKLEDLREAQISKAISAIENAQKKKTGVAATATEEIRNIQLNPILPVEPGEMRELVGYKVQFTSRDGRYDCVDMAKQAPDNIRPVNINTLAWIVFDGVRYVVK